MEEELHCPKGWEIKYSQSKEPGRPYYVRISDGHRQWEPPSEYSWEIVAAVIVLAAVGLYPVGEEVPLMPAQLHEAREDEAAAEAEHQLVNHQLLVQSFLHRRKASRRDGLGMSSSG